MAIIKARIINNREKNSGGLAGSVKRGFTEKKRSVVSLIFVAKDQHPDHRSRMRMIRMAVRFLKKILTEPGWEILCALSDSNSKIDVFIKIPPIIRMMVGSKPDSDCC